MNQVFRLRGLTQHFLLTLRLNFRSRQAIAYGYLMPVLFLLAFGGLFRGDTPPLQHEMGQLLTITLLGGACFGLPTALVAERERGLWRRYRLLPVSPGSLLIGTLLARLVLIASGAFLQIGLARLLYGTPWPAAPGILLVGFLTVSCAFLGLGLLVAAIAEDVPAVQALGQCLFLPMIMLGGVGVPLAVLPTWAQTLSGFMPGRYAVNLLQHAFVGSGDSAGLGYSAMALMVIGLAAGSAGIRLIRWEPGQRLARSAWAWVAGALLAWLLVGAGAAATGRLHWPQSGAESAATLGEAEIAQITFEDLPGDHELATPVAPPFRDANQFADFRHQLSTWAPGWADDRAVAVTHLLNVAAVADIGIDPRESQIARAVFDELRARHDERTLTRLLAWIILHPRSENMIAHAPELGLPRHPPVEVVQERTVLYAKKLLGRLRGQLPD
jgi:ABC-2 type transport system permease protein